MGRRSRAPQEHNENAQSNEGDHMTVLIETDHRTIQPDSGDPVRIATVRFTADDGRPVSWDAESLGRLGASFDAIAAERANGQEAVDAVVITGGERGFSAGADLGSFLRIDEYTDAETVATAGYAALDRLSELDVPTIAVVAGAALGGGLELALRADFRIGVGRTVLGLPELKLGLIPGWGGLSYLAAVVGLAEAARIGVTNALRGKHLVSAEAHALGLLDAVVEPAGAELSGAERGSTEQSGAGLAAVDAAIVSIVRAGRAEALASRAAGLATLPAFDSDVFAARTRAQNPGERRAVETALGLLDDLAAAASVGSWPAPVAEARGVRPRDPLRDRVVPGFASLLMSDESRAAIYAFFAVSAAAKRPASPASGDGVVPIRAAGVVGAGAMATQIATLLAEKLDVPVTITDVSTGHVDAGLDRIASQLAKRVERGDLSESRARLIGAHITGSTDVASHASADVVIEAVVEELDVKRAVWSGVADAVGEDTLLLTNTSSLSVSAQAEGLASPDRFLGFHFFNPVAVLPLVEVSVTAATSEVSARRALDLAHALGKTAVRTSDTAGFVVNRIITRLISEVLARVDAGEDAVVVDHALDRFGLPMTPLTLLGYIGPVVQRRILDRLAAEFPDRFVESPSLRLLAEAGERGYLDRDGSLTPTATAILERVVEQPGPRVPAVAGSALQSDLLDALAQEVGTMLADGVVASARDIDVCLMLGANYPPHLGGLTPLLDRTGAAERVLGQRFNAPGVASVPTGRHTHTPNRETTP